MTGGSGEPLGVVVDIVPLTVEGTGGVLGGFGGTC